MPPFVAYHGVSAPEHQARVDELASQGFRPISLGVSGEPDDARCVAVWVQRPGPSWWEVHGLSADEYQTAFDELTTGGYAPILVSATGPVERATFTALFEQGVTLPWFARHGLRWHPPDDPPTITYENARAFRDGFVPHCLAVYGTPGDRRFAGVWIKNDAPVAWSWWWADRTLTRSSSTPKCRVDSGRRGCPWPPTASTWRCSGMIRSANRGPAMASPPSSTRASSTPGSLPASCLSPCKPAAQEPTPGTRRSSHAPSFRSPAVRP
jgi:hypothetical protein